MVGPPSAVTELALVRFDWNGGADQSELLNDCFPSMQLSERVRAFNEG